MADITMCTQSFCPDWGICYRAQATPSHMQSMAAFEYSIVDGIASCENYVPVYREPKNDDASRDKQDDLEDQVRYV